MNKKKKVALGAAVLAMSSFGAVKAHALSVDQIAQAATPVANEYGLYPSVMIAQGILESGGGTSQLATQYNNIFGVKYTSGTPANMMTQEFLGGQMLDMVQPFQIYDSLTDACIAHAELMQSGLYNGVLRANAATYEDATAALQGVYATDPNYAEKLNEVISEYGLTAYDNGGTPVATSTADSSNASGNATYTVQAGDSLTSIAAQYGVTVASIASYNGISDSNNLIVGTTLVIPGASAQTTTTNSSSAANGNVYTIQAGDSFDSIAAQFGISAQDLISYNGLNPEGNLIPGTTLNIPTSAQSSTEQTTSTATNSTYTVQAGDNLTQIAVAYQTTPSEIMAINGISDASSIYPGQTLNV